MSENAVTDVKNVEDSEIVAGRNGSEGGMDDQRQQLWEAWQSEWGKAGLACDTVCALRFNDYMASGFPKDGLSIRRAAAAAAKVSGVMFTLEMVGTVVTPPPVVEQSPMKAFKEAIDWAKCVLGDEWRNPAISARYVRWGTAMGTRLYLRNDCSWELCDENGRLRGSGDRPLPRLDFRNAFLQVPSPAKPAKPSPMQAALDWAKGVMGDEWVEPEEVDSLWFGWSRGDRLLTLFSHSWEETVPGECRDYGDLANANAFREVFREVNADRIEAKPKPDGCLVCGEARSKHYKMCRGHVEEWDTDVAVNGPYGLGLEDWVARRKGEIEYARRAHEVWADPSKAAACRTGLIDTANPIAGYHRAIGRNCPRCDTPGATGPDTDIDCPGCGRWTYSDCVTDDVVRAWWEPQQRFSSKRMSIGGKAEADTDERSFRVGPRNHATKQAALADRWCVEQTEARREYYKTRFRDVFKSRRDADVSARLEELKEPGPQTRAYHDHIKRIRGLG